VGAAIDITNPADPKRIAIVASNPAVSELTGLPVGFWWAELTHPYFEFVARGYKVDICSPDGGKLLGDSWSDPRDENKLMADDLISLGFMSSPDHAALVDDSKPIGEISVRDYDAVLFVGGEGPMYTFYENERVHELAADFYQAGKITVVICHATCLLLKARANGALIVKDRTWTGFATSEEKYADEFFGRRVQPFWIEEEAKKLPDTNFIVAGRFKSHAVRDGNLITGQQQYSATAAARLAIQALGV
jgi:putative intracellular protease/amidase